MKSRTTPIVRSSMAVSRTSVAAFGATRPTGRQGFNGNKTRVSKWMRSGTRSEFYRLGSETSLTGLLNKKLLKLVRSTPGNEKPWQVANDGRDTEGHGSDENDV